MNHELWQYNTIYAYRNRYELRIRFTKFASTSVENPLQINLFMQNKPNFRKAKMNANSLITIAYENKHNWTLGQNKPNSNPNKPNLRKAKMDVNIYYTKVYENISDWTLGENKPNFVKGPK